MLPVYWGLSALGDTGTVRGEKREDADKPAPKEEPPQEAPAEPPKEETPPEEQTPTAEEPTGVFLKRPESVSVENGNDVAVRAQVNGKQLPGKPTITWFKGKWLELGIKSGARFSFKETHDPASSVRPLRDAGGVYNVELHIKKVMLGDRGDYRLEVKAKDVCDSCSFNIDVEAPSQDTSAQSLESFRRSEVVEQEKKKKKDDDDLGIPPEIWELLKGAKKSEYERIAFQYGITDLRGMLKRLKKAKVEVKKSEAFTKKLDPAYQVDKGNKIKLTVEISDPDLPLKWFKNGQEIKPSSKYVFENVGKKRILTINKCTMADDAAYEVAVANEKCFTELFVKEPPVLIVTPLEDQQVFVGDRVEMVVEVSEDGAQVMWLKDGVEMTREDSYKARYRFKKDGKRHLLIFSEVTLEDSGRYQVMTNGGQSEADLIVEEIKVEYVPKQGYLMERKKKGSHRWMKLNFEVFPETTYECTKMIEGVLYEMRVFAVNAIGVSQPSVNTKPFMPIAPTSEPQHLTVEDVTDTTTTLKWRPPNRIGAGGIDGYLVEYCLEDSEDWIPANTEPVERCGFTVKNLPTGARLMFRVVGVNIAGRSEPAILAQPVTIREIVEQPKIRLPRHLRQTYVRKVGEPINLLIPFQYELCVQIENMKDTATICICVVEKAGPPVNVTVKEVWGTNALVEWQPPKDDGNSEVTGYLIQKADKKTMEWFTVYERSRHTHCTVADLIVGNEYYFRVFSENVCGLSESPGVSKTTARILKSGINMKPFEYKQHDFRTPPKFLTPLLDRVVVAGYNAALNCAVRGDPKPKVVWMKNKMEIREDPKFLMTNFQGVLTLSIRRPSPFDSGTYSCLAVNELGEALAECKLDVRGELAAPLPGQPRPRPSRS
ncbi:Myosin-binding protein C, fast-type [Pteropus alecto]|uniref:Myosin-binding protein C, fast-type n=1 Tax=Pteropus alecto TaxID=9402 RepID=L5L5G3_PTEAL|nr:Myosin-binding protein C, fast-type [Pteropus alecto]